MSETSGQAQAEPAALKLVYFVHFCAFGVFLPFFPRWLEARGVTGLEAGVLLAVPPAVSVVAPPALGLLADAFGLRGQLLRAASLLAAAAFGLCALLAHQMASSALLFALLMALYALARTPLFGIVDVLALESLADQPARFGRLRLFGSLGFLCAAAGFGALFSSTSATTLPLVVSGLYLATFVTTLRLPTRAPRLAGISLEQMRILGRDFAFFGALLLWQVGNAAYDICYSLHVRDLGFSDGIIGALWALGVVAEVVLMAASMSFMRSVAPRRLLVFGMSAAVLRWLLIGQTTSLVGLIALQPLHALSFALTWLAATARLPSLAHQGRLATAQGMLTGAVGTGSVLGAVLFAELYEKRGGSFVFSVACGVTLLALAALLGLRTAPQPQTI